MKTPKTRTLTLLIAVVLPLAYLTYWLLRMSSLPLAADIVLVAGVIAAVARAPLRSGGERRPAGSRPRSSSVSFSVA